jgi:hypothetical protein
MQSQLLAELAQWMIFRDDLRQPEACQPQQPHFARPAGEVLHHA